MCKVYSTKKFPCLCTLTFVVTPAATAYDKARLADRGKDKFPFDPWQIPQSDMVMQSRGKRAFGYSQGDLAKSMMGEAKLLFAALSPPEKGFFSGKHSGQIGKKMIAEFYDRIHSGGEKAAIEWLCRNLRLQPGGKSPEKSMFDFLQNRSMNFPVERILHMQNGHYDYFEELIKEYKFYKSKASQPGITAEALQLYPEGQKKNWSGTYHLARNGKDFLERFDPDAQEVMMVLTIEGIHALGIGNPEDEAIREGEQKKDITIGKLKSRIRQLKGEEPLEDSDLAAWEHRPFFITFAQHFNNTLCGHAQSFPGSSDLIFDQGKNLDKGILKQGTYEVMQELLGLDGDLHATGSRRIHIDVKHMSAAARSDYYKHIVRPFNLRPANKDCKIPVIASNVGYSGIDRLEIQMKNARLEKEDDNFRVGKFLAWNINLSDEDVIEVHQSRGLIGISFDRRMLGALNDQWLTKVPIKSVIRHQAMKLFARTIEAFICIPFAYCLDDPLRIWNTLCLGTGFDGLIDPVSRYSTVLEFKTFEADLTEILHGLKDHEPLWFGSHRPEDLARNICFTNAVEFVKKNFD